MMNGITTTRRVLFVEDETSIREAVKMNLELEGYEVVTQTDGKGVLQMFKQQHFDLALLDIMLPETNGLQICEQIRLINEFIPIILLTAKDGVQARLTGLRAGADDYITKPFSIEELLLRMNNLLKRSGRELPVMRDEEYSFSGNSINFRTYEATTFDGKNIKLSKKEMMILKLLIEHVGEVVSRQQILLNVWGYEVFPSTRTVDNFILAFRKYFEHDPHNPVHFHSIRGVGYRFYNEQ